ncbi:MAG: thiamine diphosphokinase [Chloroflexi bacterium]|nr:thiamine diphosphokinase [Chloroflexota bacterium]
MKTVIFANGELRDLAGARGMIEARDRLIAADGGARHCRAMGLTPHVVVGDFDSLSPDERADLERSGARMVAHPARKDETDLELALRLAIAERAGDILVLGAFGGRWDQTLANLLLLALFPSTLPPAAGGAGAGPRLRLADGAQQIYLIRGQAQIEGRIGDTVSLIPIGGDARGVTTTGLEYSLTGGALPFGRTLGVSNVLVSEKATVTIRDGMVLCVVISN